MSNAVVDGPLESLARQVKLAESRAAFVGCLNRLYEHFGRPSFRDIERRSEHSRHRVGYETARLLLRGDSDPHERSLVGFLYGVGLPERYQWHYVERLRALYPANPSAATRRKEASTIAQPRSLKFARLEVAAWCEFLWFERDGLPPRTFKNETNAAYRYFKQSEDTDPVFDIAILNEAADEAYLVNQVGIHVKSIANQTMRRGGATPYKVPFLEHYTVNLPSYNDEADRMYKWSEGSFDERPIDRDFHAKVNDPVVIPAMSAFRYSIRLGNYDGSLPRWCLLSFFVNTSQGRLRSEMVLLEKW